MENSRRCEIFKIVVHRASFTKHLKSKKHLENLRQDETILSEWLFKAEQEPIQKKIRKVYNPKRSKQITRDNIKLNAKNWMKQ